MQRFQDILVSFSENWKWGLQVTALVALAALVGGGLFALAVLSIAAFIAHFFNLELRTWPLVGVGLLIGVPWSVGSFFRYLGWDELPGGKR